MDAGLSYPDAVQFLTRHGSPNTARQTLVVDVRTDNMLFLNDLERDPQYARFSSSVRDVRPAARYRMRVNRATF